MHKSLVFSWSITQTLGNGNHQAHHSHYWKVVFLVTYCRLRFCYNYVNFISFLWNSQICIPWTFKQMHNNYGMLNYIRTYIILLYAWAIIIHYILVPTVRETLQPPEDGVPTQKYPLWDVLALVIISVLFIVFPVVLLMKLILSSCWSTCSMAPVLSMNLYHCNTQVNTALLPSHVVTSLGSLITVVSRNKNG